MEKALAVRKALAAADPSNAGWQRDLCTSLIAQVARDPAAATRDLDEARTIYGPLQRDGFFRGDAQFMQLGAALDRLVARVRTAGSR